MRSSAALLVVALLVVSSAAGVGAGDPGDGPDSAADSDRLASERVSAIDSDPASASATTDNTSNTTVQDGTTLRISLRENGDARWSVTARFALQDDNETAAFRRVAREYENGTADVGFTRSTFERIADRASASTGRPMAVRNVSRSGYIRNNGSAGLLRLSFTWTNFTRVKGSQIVLGDAFTTDSGTWLPSLDDDQTLVVQAPDGYLVLSSNVPVQNGTLRYEGPERFEPGQISVTYERRSTATTVGNTTTPGVVPDFTGPSGLLLVLFVFGLGGGGAYVLSQRRGADPDPKPTADDRETESPATPVSAPDEPEASEEEDEDEPDTELLSDEERVLRLLRENDGRMKQANIVSETNWSNAKVSQLLSKMDENDDVDKLRIGRENLITLPDEDVTDVD